MRLIAGSSLSALLALGLAYLRLASVDSRWWLARDDAVITFSHARNLVRFGSIGVSPGDRVEGFSSPIQFLLSSAVLFVRDLGFGELSLVIIGFCVAGTGAATFVFFSWVANRASLPSRQALVVSGLSSLVFLLGVVSWWTTFGWVAAGMENAPALFLMVAVAAAFPLLRRSGPWPVVPSILLGLLATARVEFAALAAPLLVVFLLEVVASTRQSGELPTPVDASWRRLLQRRVLIGVGPAVALIGAVHLARRVYFGAWLPNTAVVQDRFSGVRQLLVLALLSVAACVFVSLIYRREMRRRRNAPRTTTALLLGLLFIPVAQYVVMGPARLDRYRVLSLALPVLLLWLGVVVIGSMSSTTLLASRVANSVTSALRASTAWVALFTVALAGLALDPPRVLDYEVAGYGEIQVAAQQFRDERLSASSLPIVANPDLGKLSFQKEALMVDLGLLGDPLLARLWKTDRSLAVDYITDISMPDVLELQGYWSCEYRELLQSDAFQSAYGPTDERWLEAGAVEGWRDCPFGGRYIIWERTASAEYSLDRRLATDPEPTMLIAQALAACASEGTDPLRCQPVRRAVQRSIVSLQRADHWDAAVDAFAASPTAALDEELLRRRSGWWERAAEQISLLLRPAVGEAGR